MDREVRELRLNRRGTGGARQAAANNRVARDRLSSIPSLPALPPGGAVVGVVGGTVPLRAAPDQWFTSAEPMPHVAPGVPDHERRREPTGQARSSNRTAAAAAATSDTTREPPPRRRQWEHERRLPPVPPRVWRRPPDIPLTDNTFVHKYPEDIIGRDALDVVLEWRARLGWSTTPDEDASFETGMPLRPEYIAEQIAKKKRPDPGIKAKVDTGLKSPTELKFVNQASYECGVLMTCVAAFPDLYTLIITDPSKPQPNDFFHVTVFGINRLEHKITVESFPILRFAWERARTRHLLAIPYFKYLRARVVFREWKNYTRARKRQAVRSALMKTTVPGNAEMQVGWVKVQTLCQAFYPRQDRLAPMNNAWLEMPLKEIWKNMACTFHSVHYAYRKDQEKLPYPAFGCVHDRFVSNAVDEAMPVEEYFKYIDTRLDLLEKKQQDLERQVVIAIHQVCVETLVARNFPDFIPKAHRTQRVIDACDNLVLDPVFDMQMGRENRFRGVIKELRDFTQSVECQLQAMLKSAAFSIFESFLFNFLHATFYEDGPPDFATPGIVTGDEYKELIKQFYDDEPLPLWAFTVVDSNDKVRHMPLEREEIKVERPYGGDKRAEYLKKGTFKRKSKPVLYVDEGEGPTYVSPGPDIVGYHLQKMMTKITDLVKKFRRPSHYNALHSYVTMPEQLVNHFEDTDKYRPPTSERLLTVQQVEQLEGLDVMMKIMHRTAETALTRAIKQLEVFEDAVDISDDINTLSEVGELTAEHAEEFRERLARHKDQISAVVKVPKYKRVGAVMLDARQLHQTMQQCPEIQYDKTREALLGAAIKQNEEVADTIRDSYVSVRDEPRNVNEVVSMYRVIHRLIEGLPRLEQSVEATKKLFELVKDYDVSIQGETMASYRNTLRDLDKYRTVLRERDASKDLMMQEFGDSLEQELQTMRQNMSNLIQETQHPELLDDETSEKQALLMIGSRERQHEDLTALITRFADYLQEFRNSATSASSRTRRFVNTEHLDKKQEILDEVRTWLRNCKQKLLLLKQLWTSRQRVKEVWESGDRVPTQEELEDMQTEITRLAQIKLTLERSWPDSSAVKALTGDVNKLKDILPLMGHLSNPSLCDRHWKMIGDKCPRLQLTAKCTLNGVLAAGDGVNADVISEIAIRATQEAAVSTMLQKIKKSSYGLMFTLEACKEYERCTLVTDTDMLLVTLEDNAVVMQGLVTSKFGAHIRAELKEFEVILNHTIQGVTQWLMFQKNWLFLMSVLSSRDVQRQLVRSYTLLKKAEQRYQLLMDNVANDPSVVRHASVPSVIEMLEASNASMDKVYRSLADYLETKRMGFPRFFFLSDEELTALLANVKNPQAVEVHLRKCFFNVRDFMWVQVAGGNLLVGGATSHEGEILKLECELLARGEVTGWMERLSRTLRLAVSKGVATAIQTFEMEPTMEYLEGNLSQAVTVACQVQWARAVEPVLGEANVDRLKALKSQWRQRLVQLSELVLNDMKPNHRNTLTNLITVEVHLRDVIKSLISEAQLGEQRFLWERTLKYDYSLSAEKTDLALCQWRTAVRYCMEFVGAAPGLVITPLTDRCFLTMMMALKQNLGGAPSGPAGTGKTESVKELAKAAGKYCVVFNCSEELDYSMLGGWFSGMVQTGAWLCMDEFNRIELEVLSVVSTMLRAIKVAKQCRYTRFLFNGSDIELDLSSAFFVTNNPGYRGRVELPQNLKEYFRPIAMTVPDAGSIMEVVLFSVGFRSAPALAKKVVKLYDSAAAAFSKAQHYDFGLRAIKSMLMVAGKKKQEFLRSGQKVSSLSALEAQIIVDALHETNQSKLIAADMPTFSSLVTALFPKTTVSPSTSGLLEHALLSSIRALDLVEDSKQLAKALQLHNTMHVRHGLMLIGPAGGGKSTILKVLAGALDKVMSVRARLLDALLSKHKAHRKTTKLDYLDDANRPDEFVLPSDIKRTSTKRRYKGIDCATVHPKCMSIKDLYGAADKSRTVVCDGLVTRVVRLFEQQLSQAAKVYLPYEKEQEEKAARNPGRRDGGGSRKTTAQSTAGSVSGEHSTEEYMEFDKGVAPYGWRWLVLDGPVDSSWIENLNTTLDDTKMLSLASGERIYLVPGMRIIFEVDDLENASPATISRCGMVYVDSGELDWRILVRKWLQSLPKSLTDDDRKQLNGLFEAVVDSGITLVERYKHVMPVTMTTTGLITTLMALLSGFLEYVESHGGYATNAPAEPKTKRQSKWKARVQKAKIVTILSHSLDARMALIGRMFAMAYVWSFGTVFQQDVEVETTNLGSGPMPLSNLPVIFDMHVRNRLSGSPPLGVRFPPQPSRLIDYVLDFDLGQFIKWNEYIPEMDCTKLPTYDPLAGKVFNTHNFFDTLFADTRILDNLLLATPETARTAVIVALLLRQRRSVLLTGEPGSGKSMLLQRCMARFCTVSDGFDGHQNLVESYLSHSNYRMVHALRATIAPEPTLEVKDDDASDDEPSGPSASWISNIAHCTLSTTPSTLRQRWMRSVVKKQRKVYVPPAGKQRLLLAVEDLHIPEPSSSGLVTETVRQYLDTGTIYDRRSNWMMLEDCAVVATCKSHAKLSPRLLRHFCSVHLRGLDTKTLQGLYACILRLQWADKFSLELMNLVPTLVNGVVYVCERIQKELHPTPSRPHYIFDSRDINKAVLGLRCATSSIMDNRESAIKLLSFALRCTFRDRINDHLDLKKFTEIHDDMLRVTFEMVLVVRESFLRDERVVTDLLDAALSPPPRNLATVADPTVLNVALKQCQEQYNLTKGVQPLTLVFFDTISRHVVRLSRAMNQPGGHAVLIGLVGTGRASVARLVALMDHLEWSEVSGSGTGDMQAAFKTCYRDAVRRAVGEDKGTMIFVSTAQLSKSQLSHLDAITTVMQHGWLPGIIEHLEAEALVQAAERRSHQPWQTKRPASGHQPRQTKRPASGHQPSQTKRPASSKSMTAEPDHEEKLKECAMRHIHIVVAVSSAGQLFRQVCLSHPQLLTSALSVNWFERWDDMALLRVAFEGLKDMQVPMVTDEGTLKKLREVAVRACVRMHNEACKLQQEVEDMGGQMMYITPNIYQLFIQTYLKQLHAMGEHWGERKNRLEKGGEQLASSSGYIEKLKKDIETLQPQLDEKKKDMDQLLQDLLAKKTNIDEQGRNIERERNELDGEKASLEIEVDKATEAVEKAKPALESALKSLDSISKQDIAEIRMYNKPPQMVVMVMCAVCELLDVKAEWEAAKGLLIEANFTHRLVSYDCDRVSNQMLKRLSKYTSDPSFTPAHLKRTSVACQSLCGWVIAVDDFCKAKRILDPRLRALNETHEELKEAERRLGAKTEQHVKVLQRISDLEAALRSKECEYEALELEITKSHEHLNRALQILDGLNDEATRWAALAWKANANLQSVLGDAMLTAAGLVYAGVHNAGFRNALFERWQQVQSLPTSTEYCFVSTLEPQTKIHNWVSLGLPHDAHSSENAVILTHCKRWPLLIDPQHQARRWLTQLQKGIEIIDWQQPQARSLVGRAMAFGSTILIENVPSVIDATLKIFIQSSQKARDTGAVVSFSDGITLVDCNPAFGMYLVSAEMKPNYLPEVFCLTTVINFTITLDALKDQLLTDILSYEMPELEKRRPELLQEISALQLELEAVENQMLTVFEEGGSVLLEDTSAVEQLMRCKETASNVAKKMESAEKAQLEVENGRAYYRGIAKRGGAVFSAIQDLPSLSGLYHVSSQLYRKGFIAAVLKAREIVTETDETRRDTIVDIFVAEVTRVGFGLVLGSLAEQHQHVFALLVVVHVLLEDQVDKKQSSLLWETLIQAPLYDSKPSIGRGGEHEHLAGHQSLAEVFSAVREQGGENTAAFVPLYAGGGGGPAKPPISWLTTRQWRQVQHLDAKLTFAFKGICRHMLTHPTYWERFVEGSINTVQWKLTAADLAGAAATGAQDTRKEGDVVLDDLSPLCKLILVRILRPNCLLEFVKDLVPKVLEIDELPSPLTLSETFDIFDYHTPLMLIVSEGSEAVKTILRVAKAQENAVSVVSQAVGCNGGPLADELIQKAKEIGNWVVLQNCHTAKSWMDRLDQIVARDVVNNENLHPNFRLWLTVEAVESTMPPTILQNCAKYTMKSRSGFCENVQRLLDGGRGMYLSNEKFEEEIGKDEEDEDRQQWKQQWKQLMFNMCLMHSLLLEHNSGYQQMALNEVYQFTNADYASSCKTLLLVCHAHKQVPWRMFEHLIGAVLYGGRITDPRDHVTVQATLRRFLSAAVFEPDWKVAGISLHMDADATLQSCRDLVRPLGDADIAALMGLPTYAPALMAEKHCAVFVEDLKKLQPEFIMSATLRASAEDTERYLVKMLSIITDAIPLPLHLQAPKSEDTVGILERFLRSECQQYNDLMALITHDVQSLQATLQASNPSSAYLDILARDLLSARVPDCWKMASYPTSLLLGAWLSNLSKRMTYMRNCVGHFALIVRSQQQHQQQPSVFSRNPRGGPKASALIQQLSFIYWLGGMFKPKAFLTTLLMEYANRSGTPMEKLQMKWTIKGIVTPQLKRNQFSERKGQSVPVDLGKAQQKSAAGTHLRTDPKAEKIQIKGMVLCGAGWDPGRECLQELDIGERNQELGIVELCIEDPASSSSSSS
eukprot:scpid1048/ scgid0074/ Dynein-1-alpha heavy chain, flagellar inner arm I1 complex; 1-alpha DHC; Dynein-1, subspecies f